eukprot:gene11543-24148_t
MADRNRVTRETDMNDLSSRSHSIFQVNIDRSERWDKIGAKSNGNSGINIDMERWDRFDSKPDKDESKITEMNSINLSLHTLGRCISALAAASSSSSKKGGSGVGRGGGGGVTKDTGRHIPYRENIEETLSTIKFADRARQVMTSVEANESRPVDYAVVKKLRKELAMYKGILQEISYQYSNGLPLTIPNISDIKELYYNKYIISLNLYDYGVMTNNNTDKVSDNVSEYVSDPRKYHSNIIHSPRIALQSGNSTPRRQVSLPGDAGSRVSWSPGGRHAQIQSQGQGQGHSPRWGGGSPRVLVVPPSPKNAAGTGAGVVGSMSPRKGGNLTPRMPLMPETRVVSLPAIQDNDYTTTAIPPQSTVTPRGSSGSSALRDQLREAENTMLRSKQRTLEEDNKRLWELVTKVK